MLKVFQVKRGDQFSFIVNFKNLNQDLSTIRFGLKEDYEKPLLIDKSLGDGIVKIDTKHYQVNFSVSDTSAIDAGMYVFDLRYTIGDTPKTPVSGYVLFQDSVFSNNQES